MPTAAIYWKIQNYYLNISRELKRIENSTRSPILDSIKEIQTTGISVIRAFGQEPFFIQKMVNLLDKNTEAYLSTFCLELWLTIRLEVLAV